MTNSTLQSAYRYCEQMAKSHYENFPVGSLLIPRLKRPHVWSAYAFARTTDDFADENYPSRKHFHSEEEWRQAIAKGEGERLKKLNEWEDQLKACYEGKADHPVFMALGNTVRELNIPLKLLTDLLYAFKMDVTKRRYQNWEEVLHYCHHSADPVGRFVLMIFGYRDEKLFEFSDAICTGLQLANFWQDIGIDREKDRIYIPLDLLEKFGLSDEAVFDPRPEQNWKGLLEALGKYTSQIFEKGRPLPRLVSGRLSWELRCAWLGGITILNRACASPNRLITERPKISGMDKMKILVKSLFAYPDAVAIT